MLCYVINHRISPHVGVCQRRSKQAEVSADLYVAQLRITLVYQLWWHLLAISVIPDMEQYHWNNTWIRRSYTISVGWLRISELHSDQLLSIWMPQPLGSLNETAASWIKRHSMETISTRLVLPLAWFASLLRSRLRGQTFCTGCRAMCSQCWAHAATGGNCRCFPRANERPLQKLDCEPIASYWAFGSVFKDASIIYMPNI